MKTDYTSHKYFDEKNHSVVYLSNVITDPDIIVGAHTYYHDEKNDPADFVKNNVLYHYPGFTHDKIVIGKYCSLAMGTSFICSAACHSLNSMSTYPFGIANNYWDLPAECCDLDVIVNTKKGPTIVGNDVWFGRDSLIMPGVTIGDGAIIGTRALVTKDVEPYTIVGGVPAKVIRKRYDDATIARLLEIKWWDMPDDDVKRIIPDIIKGDIHALSNKCEIMRHTRKIMGNI